MYEFQAVSNPSDEARFCTAAGFDSLSPDALHRHPADAHGMLVDAAGAVMARCSLWWTATPPYADHRLGLIGHYAAQNSAAAGPLLQRACHELARHGCTLAVGPMDGNTWQRYRLLTERGPEPIFFLEPDNPDDWPRHFTDNGFTVLAQYYSALNTNLEEQDPRVPEMARRLEGQGFVLRPLRLDQFEEELRRIHAVSLASFAHNFLYTPITEEDFVAQYRPIQAFVRPELVLIAEQHGQPAGYVFALPDLVQARRGQIVDTVIVKTLAVHPDHAGAGLGGLLTARCHEAARQLGYIRAIHALMHETNNSRRISGHTARTIRRYTLFARPLGDRA